MALARTNSVAFEGVTARIVDVEANVGPGLPGTYIVGLADKAVAESRDRIKLAAQNSHLPWPKTKIIVSLSPASLRKSGSHFDLPMVLSILFASDTGTYEEHVLSTTVFLGELSLDGAIKPVTGVIPAILAAKQAGFVRVVIPTGNAAEATLCQDMDIRVASSLAEVVRFVCGEEELDHADDAASEPGTDSSATRDMRDVAGQPEARRAAEIAAAGGHNFLMIGPPGSGKSMIAARLPGLLPDLTPDHKLEATAVHSVAGRTFTVPSPSHRLLHHTTPSHERRSSAEDPETPCPARCHWRTGECCSSMRFLRSPRPSWIACVPRWNRVMCDSFGHAGMSTSRRSSNW